MSVHPLTLSGLSFWGNKGPQLGYNHKLVGAWLSVTLWCTILGIPRCLFAPGLHLWGFVLHSGLDLLFWIFSWTSFLKASDHHPHGCLATCMGHASEDQDLVDLTLLWTLRVSPFRFVVRLPPLRPSSLDLDFILWHLPLPRHRHLPGSRLLAQK